MGTYLKKFTSESQYTRYINGKKILPNVSLITGTNNIMKYNPSKLNYFNDYPYVDFGLPSGTLWAKCNVGAQNVYSSGDYFQWGDINEVEKASKCNWTTYKYGNGTDNVNESAMTKYNITDGLTKLKMSDDAANENMGGKWRIPTVDDGIELLANTTLSWVNNYQFQGANGLVLYGKGIYSATTLFLPAAGYRFGGDPENTGTHIYLWTSSLYATKTQAYYFIGGSQFGDFNMHTNRATGLPIRAVIKP